MANQSYLGRISLPRTRKMCCTIRVGDFRWFIISNVRGKVVGAVFS